MLKHWAYEQQVRVEYLDKIDVLLAGKGKGKSLMKRVRLHIIAIEPSQYMS